MKVASPQVCILILFILVIILRIFTEIHNIRKEQAGGNVRVLYLITQIKDDCWYSGGMYYYQVPRCEANLVGEYLDLTGTVDTTSDSRFYNKKRLIISEKSVYIPAKLSFKYWNSLYVQWRKYIWDKLSAPVHELLPYPHSAVLLSMVFGDKEGIDAKTSELFSLTGTTHVQAVSGYNFAVISAGIYQVVKKHARKKAQAILILAVVIGFTIVVGFQPSVVRAALTVLAILTTEFFLIRQYNAWFYLGIVLLLMLFVSPEWIFSISFQLSGAATAGILYFYPFLSTYLDLSKSKLLRELLRYSWVKNLCSEVANSFLIAVSATLATFPLLLWHFQELTLVGMFITSLCSYLLSAIVVIGFWTALISIGLYHTVMSKVLFIWMTLCLYVPIEMYLFVLKQSVAVQFLNFSFHTFTWLDLVLCYGVLLGGAWYLHQKKSHRYANQPKFI